MIPKRLKKGDTIGIVAPSNPFGEKYRKGLESAENVIKGIGLNVKYSKNFYKVDKYGVSAGSPKERADDINSFFSDSNIKMMWCSHGGDTANQVLEYLDFNLIKKNPKIFMGLSDITLLLNAIYKETGLVTFHGTDFKSGINSEHFGSNYTQKEFRVRFVDGVIGKVNNNSKWKCIRKGKAKGEILGGNIRCFLKLAGTKYIPHLKGGILLLEGYHIELRSAVNLITRLRTMGVFKEMSGIIVGSVYSFDKEKQIDKDRRRVYFEDIVLDITKDYDFPILKIYEFGHRCPSTFLPIGGEAEIDAEKLMFKITKKCVD